MNESSKANDHDTPESEGPDIVEPELGAATISEDVAETVDLKAAEAEAAAVEHEAALASRTVSPELGKPDAGAAAAPVVASPGKSAADEVPAEAVAADVAPSADSPVTAASPDQPETPADATPVAPDAAHEPESGQVVPPQKPGHIGPGVDDGHGWRRPEAQWEQSSTPWQPKAGGWQSPAQISRNAAEAAAASASQIPAAPAEAPAAGAPTNADDPVNPAGPTGAGNSAKSGNPKPVSPDKSAGPPVPTPAPGSATASQVPVPPAPGRQASIPPANGTPGVTVSGSGSDGNPKKILIVAGIVLVGLALLVLFIMLVVGLFTGNKSNSSALPAGSISAQSLASTANSSGGTPDSDLIVAGVSPLDWMKGDCLRDFKGTSEPADVVRCNSPHNAQLVGTFYYGETDAFPGAASLKVKATNVCEGVVFTSDASGLSTLKQSTAYPSESTWNDKDDRRVDCMVHDTRSGNPLDVSLTQ